MKGWTKDKFQLIPRRQKTENRQKGRKTLLRIYCMRILERWGPILLVDPWGGVSGHRVSLSLEGRERSNIIIKGINRQPVFITRHNTTSQRKVQLKFLEWELASEMAGKGGACGMKAKFNPIYLKKEKPSSLYTLLYPTQNSKLESP